MSLSTKLTAALMGGLLLAVAYTPAFAGPAADATASAPATTGAPDRSLVGVLSPILADTVQHKAQKTCKPDSLYSQHSVVGDPDACFNSHVDVRTVTGVGGGLGSVL